MYTRLKKWVNDAYKQILLKRQESYLRNERTVLTVRPRIQVTSQVPGFTLGAGDEYIGRDSGVRFVVRAYHSNSLDPDKDINLDIEYSDPTDTNLIVGEQLDRISPTAFASAFMVEGHTGYDFSLYIPTLDQVNIDGMSFQNVPNNLVDNDIGPAQNIYALQYDRWHGNLFPEFSHNGSPQYVTRGPNGNIEFWPRLDKAYSILFEYSRTVPDMVLWNDLPYSIPAKYHEVIVYRAVMKLARFEHKDKLYLNAREEYRFFNNLMEDELLEKPHLSGNMIWA